MNTFIEWNKPQYNTNISLMENRGLLISANIADIHFGAMDPKVQYEILEKQFIEPIEQLPLDLVTIDGDLFDHKAMSNSDMVMYANKFIDALIRRVIRPKNITLIILAGTYNHDNNQLKLFYHYMNDTTIDVRIVEQLQFEYVKGARILCIPELTGREEMEYQQVLFRSGIYDMAIMHGTIKGAIVGNEVGNGRLFTINDFMYCRGPIISGHIHNGKCYNTYFYYCGSPYPWTFADDNNKGFLLCMQNLDSGDHYIYKQPITSFKYETINLDDMISCDPKTIIDYINKLKQEKNIDYIRIVFSKEVGQDTRVMLDSFYRNTSTVKFKYEFTKDMKKVQQSMEESEELKQYDYLFDNTLTEYDKLAKYINDDMGTIFVLPEEIKKFVEEEF